MPSRHHCRPSPEDCYTSDRDRWLAVMQRDERADGRFVYSVKTTGVYCRPTCPARRARRENVRFHPTYQEAERAGFRPCKRCRPNERDVDLVHIQTVAKVCRAIEAKCEATDLKALATLARMSVSHFHRVFKSVTGLTPKAYAVACRSRSTCEELRHGRSVAAAIYKAGFQSSGRFYATVAKTLGMAATKYRTGAPGETIHYAVRQCTLGAILVAATDVGVCSIALGDDPNTLVKELRNRFPKAKLIGGEVGFGQMVDTVIRFAESPGAHPQLPLDVRGTAFQQRVWQALCKIPSGKTSTYSQIAQAIGRPTAARAVAGACAANPIAIAIPCHRVVRGDGTLSGYRWGVDRKAELLKREADARKPLQSNKRRIGS